MASLIKFCPKCKQDLDISCFWRDSQRKDGYQCWCKDCCNNKKRAFYKTPEGKNSRARHNVSPAALAARNRYLKTSKGRVATAKAQKKHNDQPKRKLQLSRNNAAHRAKPGFVDHSTARHRQRTYNMTQEAADALLEFQEGGCAICGTKTHGNKHMWTTDHDHACCNGQISCGKCIRGFLCRQCNFGLGCFKDNPTILKAAILYLRCPPWRLLKK